MSGSELMDLTVLERKKYNYLNEVLDLSEQMGQVLDRNDQVSVRMLLAMREDPIRHLQEVDRMSKDRRAGLPQEDQGRIGDLLAGAAPEGRDESLFAEQAGKARRLLERVVELDKKLSIRMSGGNSFYKK